MAEKYEYSSPKRLDGVSRYFIKIPESIIYEDNAGDKLITTFSFLSIGKGLNDKCMFTVNKMVEWSGKKPDRHAGAVNSRFETAIKYLEENEYVSVDCDVSNVKSTFCCSAEINMDKIHDECNGYDFAIVYVDEIEKILNWKNQNPKDTFSNNDIVLKVFSYFRMIIKRRSNKLPKDDHDVEERKKRWPEAWNGYFNDMSKEIGVSEKAMSKAVDVLCEIGLLYFESFPRKKIGGKWRTIPSIFCNTYKREGQYLLASGEEYYKIEIKNKKKILNID